MIQKVRIQNFKSVLDLELDLGRVNVFIGENGSGKTSVLEGIAMGSAASQDKLEHEFLASRGIRVTTPRLMKPAFKVEQERADSSATFWASNDDGTEFLIDFPKRAQTDSNGFPNGISLQTIHFFEERARVKEQATESLIIQLESLEKSAPDLRESIEKLEEDLTTLMNDHEELRKLFSIIKRSIAALSPFMIFTPTEHSLLRFEEEGQILPIGIHGEGLFSHLFGLHKQDADTFTAISNNLTLLDWFEQLNIPDDLAFTERRIAITDRFIKDTIAQIDQRSANEGFLYLLFYFTLFLSKYTPAFFAIDNIDNALNPRLCAKLVQTLAKLAAENDKQAIFTTHNPAVLDGLDLEDDAQRLFVIYRNADGETKARRVMPLEEIEDVETPRLSEAFMRGYLGGLPQNF